MINIELIYGTKEILSRVTLGEGKYERTIKLNVGQFITRRNKVPANEGKQYILLNRYLNSKGVEFQEKYFELLEAGMEQIKRIAINNTLSLPYKSINNIIDLIDYEDVLKFVKLNITPPSKLADVFNMRIEQDEKGSRIQTYLKSDYLELVAVALVFKATLGLLGEYVTANKKDMTGSRIEYTIYDVYRQNKITETSPMVKLVGFITKLMEQPLASNASMIHMLEVQTSEDELKMYLLSKVVLNRVAVSTIIDDNDDLNIVTVIYNYINNKLKPPTGAKSIREKTVLSEPGTDNTAENKDSQFEAYRASTDTTNGAIIEVNFVTDTIEKVLNQLPEKMYQQVDMKALKDTSRLPRDFQKANFTHFQVTMLSIVFKNVIDPRSIPQLKRENMVILISVMFAYLIGMGYKHLAILSVCFIYEEDDEIRVVKLTGNRTRIDAQLKDQLNEVFPYKRIKNLKNDNSDDINIVEELINTLSKEVWNLKWLPAATVKKYTEGLLTDEGVYALPFDLKPSLARFILEHETNRDI